MWLADFLSVSMGVFTALNVNYFTPSKYYLTACSFTLFRLLYAKTYCGTIYGVMAFIIDVIQVKHRGLIKVGLGE